jgi:hypothetical protein
MNEELIFEDTCLIYPTTVDGYGHDVLGTPITVPCMYVQTTAYQHSSSQDAIVGTQRLALPAFDSFVLSQGYRLEGLVVEVNPFDGSGSAQRFKITSVTPARDILLGNEVHHVECDLKKIETEAYVS